MTRPSHTRLSRFFEPWCGGGDDVGGGCGGGGGEEVALAGIK